MGFLDRLRLKQPARTARGDSGRSHMDGFLQLEEMNNELRGVAGLQKFDAMYRTDPDVRRVVSMGANPVIGGTWVVEPAGEDEATDKDREVAKFVRWALFEFMRPKLKGHLAEALPVVIRSGFAPFEQVWTAAKWEGRDVLVPRKADLRLPRTIQRWVQDDSGELEAIEQWTIRGGRVEIPAADLLYYRLGGEGDNWEGTSLLRPAYKPWYLKDKIERIDAIAQEREAVGVPIAYPPKNVSDATLDEVETILANVRTNEQGYILAPGPKAEHSEKGDGWAFEILSHKSSEQRSAEPSLKYHTAKIDAAFVAEFMRLGQDGVGARATADVQQNPFLAAVEAIADQVAEVLNEQLVNRLVALNFDVEEPPKLKMSSADQTSLEELASYVGTLVEKGAIEPDDELEDFLRKRGKLPAADPEARKKRDEAAAAAPQTPPPDPKAPAAPEPTPEPKPDPAAKAPAPAPKARDRDADPGERWGRELRWWEKQMELEVIDAAITNARNRFEAAAGEAARELARTYAAAALKGTAQMPKPAGDVEAALADELSALYRLGRNTVVRELDRQRREAPPVAPQTVEDGPELARRAKLAAASIAARIWQAVSRAALARPGDQAAVQSAGEVEAATALKAEAQLHSAGALNAGRQDQATQMAEEVRGSRYTSILDGSRCEACRSADDDVLRTLTDPVRLARKPPNPDCYGGGRCRCMEFYELKLEEPGYGGPPPSSIEVTPSSPSISQHFDVSGGNAELRALVDEQIGAIQAVHDFPASLPRIPLKISAMTKQYGLFRSWISAVNRQVTKSEIAVSRAALERDPAITSVVHEIGHMLDAYGLGVDVPGGVDAGNYLSGTDVLAGWRQAVTSSNAYKQLALGGGSAYVTSVKELWARSYEQWIALRSDNDVLWAKIRARQQEQSPFLYWDDTDFRAIAEAFDEAFSARGLRR